MFIHMQDLRFHVHVVNRDILMLPVAIRRAASFYLQVTPVGVTQGGAPDRSRVVEYRSSNCFAGGS